MKTVLSASIAVLILTLGCSHDPEVNNAILVKHSPLVQAIYFSDDSLLHGIALGMKKEDVKKHALPGDSLSQEEVDYLLYEGRFSKDKTYTWDCEFDSAGLSSLTLDIYLKDETAATEWYNDLNAYYTEKYGKGTDDGMAMTWEIKNVKRPVRLELIEDTEYSYGKLSVYYYDLSFLPMESDTIPEDSLYLLEFM